MLMQHSNTLIRGMLKVLDAGGSSSGHGDNWSSDVEQDTDSLW